MKRTISLMAGLGLLAVLLVPSTGSAMEKVDGFVCPVLTAEAVGQHNPQATPIGGGDYTVGTVAVAVPITATNDDGAGTPAGDHARPGDSTYTAIWNISQ